MKFFTLSLQVILKTLYPPPPPPPPFKGGGVHTMRTSYELWQLLLPKKAVKA